MSGIRTYNFSGDSADCIGSFKSNYHMMTTMTVPIYGNYIRILIWQEASMQSFEEFPLKMHEE
jgi:hypothetical protein